MQKTIDYVCSKCHVSGSTFRVWGDFSYKVEDTLMSIDRVLGLCNDCNSFAVVEILPIEDKFYNDSGPYNIVDYEKRLSLLANRKSKARCLECGGHNFEIVPEVKYDHERARSQTPIRTSLMHKNCGGRIYGNPATPYLYMGDKLKSRFYTIEGIEIK